MEKDKLHHEPQKYFKGRLKKTRIDKGGVLAQGGKISAARNSN